MKLAELESKQLLPRFAHGVDWIQDAFDQFVKLGVARSYKLAAPLSLEAIHALTDSELQDYYKLFGIAIYYPDLSRDTREQMLFNLAKFYRYLGTPRAIEILCQYVMDDTPIEVHISDQLAFDENGTLQNESLLDVFDVELSVLASSLPETTLKRIYENIIRFKNDRTQLRGFSFLFDMTGGGFDSEIAYTDGGNYETFFEMGDFTDDIRQQAFPNNNQTPSTITSKNKDITMYNSDGSFLMLPSTTERYEVVRVYATAQDIIGTRPNLLYLGCTSTVGSVVRAILTNMSNSSLTFQRIDYRRINSVPYTFTYSLVEGTLHFTVTLTVVSGSGYITAYGYVRNSAAVTDYRIVDERDLRYIDGKFTIQTNLASSSSVDCYLNLTNLRPD